MPSRNRVKIYAEEAYYHVYNRGVNGSNIFIDGKDYAVFLNLLKRYLAQKPSKDKKGREYLSLYGQIELLAFCLMPNHFHLLVYQDNRDAMTQLLRGVATSYSTYFNKKYDRFGPLFQERFKASMITNDAYLQHISRYIHLNPMDAQQGNYLEYPYSSIGYYVGRQSASWVVPARIYDDTERDQYVAFLQDYEDMHDLLKGIEHELADT